MAFNQKAYSRRYYLANRAKIIARTNAYVAAHPKWLQRYKRSRHLRLMYGLTIADYQRLLQKQKGKCAICKRPEHKISNKSGKKQPLVVDHNHKTGEVRGLLCCRCNRSIGLLEDDPRLLLAAYKHLIKWESYVRT